MQTLVASFVLYFLYFIIISSVVASFRSNVASRRKSRLCQLSSAMGPSIDLEIKSSNVLPNMTEISRSEKLEIETECELAAEGSVHCHSASTVVLPQKSVWATFGELAAHNNAVNLGQGFPDWDPPQFVLDSLKSTTETKYHQYTRPAGHPKLVETIAYRYSGHFSRDIDPYSEVAITVGATQALYLALITLLKPGDEVVLFNPFFELYTKQIKLTGAVTKFVSMGGAAATAEDPWALDIAALERTVTDKTRVLILNSPHNPTGKVFSLAEMQAVAAVVRRFPRLVVISDEVYKYSIYAPEEAGDFTVQGHFHFARLPDMYDRTITLSSCGKTFSVTGWQVGWMVGPKRLVAPVQDVLPCVQFCASTPVQEALANALSVADRPYGGYQSFYEWQRCQFQSKRRVLETGLRAAGIEPLPSRGGFFVMGRLPRWRLSAFHESLHEPYDWKLCRQMCDNYGVVAIPASSFFAESNEHEPMARFAFCKLDSTLAEATERFQTKGRMQ